MIRPLPLLRIVCTILVFVLSCGECSASTAGPAPSAPGREFLQWQAEPGVTIEVENPVDPNKGAKAIRISGTQEDRWSYAVTTDTLSLEPGAKYHLEGWLRLDFLSDPRQPPFLKAGVLDQAGQGVAGFNTGKSDILLMHEWQRLSCEFQATGRMNRCYLAVEKGTRNRIGVKLAIRDVRLSKIDRATPPERPAFGSAPPGLKELAAQRPRLFMRGTDTSRLRSKLSRYPYSKFWTAVKTKADGFVSEVPPLQLTGDIRSLGNKLPPAAMAFLLTGKAEYLRGVRKWMDAFVSYPNWPDNRDLGAAHVLFGMSVAYDWLHDRFTPEERSRYRKKILHHAEILYAALRGREIWWANELLQNHNYTNVMAIAVAGVALYGECPEAESYLAVAESNFRKVLGLLSPDGASQEGIGYWGYATDSLLKYFRAVEPVYGMNAVLANPYFANCAGFRLHASLPGYRENVDFGDSPRFDWNGPGRILRCLASLFRDGTAQWLAERIETARGTHADLSWEDLLWHDETVKPVPPDRFPTSAYFENMGIIISRSGWTDDACWTFFKAGAPQGRNSRDKVPASTHSHPDQGGFLLWAFGKWLVIDDGYVYLKRTYNHNLSIFNGRGQLGEGKKWFDFPPLAEGVETAAVVHHAKQPSFEYIVADLTKIYPPEANIKKYERTFVILPKGYLVVKDDAVFDSPGSATSLLHFGSGALERTGTGFAFVADGKSASLGIEIFPEGDSVISALDFTIPRNEQNRDTYGNYSGRLLKLNRENADRNSTVYLLRPSKSVSTQPRIASFEGDRLQFDDAHVSFSVDFAARSVRVPLRARSETP
ncbi:MAG: DUF4962 domain-containing protein [Desulfobacteraceae bacterium]|nr:DUF4962 domain-containing protein [Desulfobacteraceae bacterium]